MLPPSGRSKPAIMRKSVVLPQPRAEQREELPGLDGETHAVDGA
jgi:hypothetical protein